MSMLFVTNQATMVPNYKISMLNSVNSKHPKAKV